MSCPTLFSCYSLPEFLGMLNNGFAVLSAVAIVCATFIGWKKVSNWEKRKKQERAIAHAERIVIAADNAKYALRRIRSEIRYGHEVNSASDELKKRYSKGEARGSQGDQIAGMICITRWSDQIRFYDEIHECMPFARAFFGEDLYTALEKIIINFNRVLNTAGSLIEQYSEGDGSRRLRSIIINSDHGEGDKISKDIDSQIAVIQNILFPYIRLDDTDKS